MLIKLNSIIIFALVAFFLSWIIYPLYIKLLHKYKLGKTIREDSATGEKSVIFSQMHEHKKGTPTMGGGIFLLVVGLMIGASYVLKHYGFVNNTLVTRQETYVLLFGFFSMGLIGLVDDILNIKGHGKVKGLSAKTKLIGMFIFAAFISRRFYSKLGVDYINFWPFGGNVSLGILYPIITFFLTISIVNAINITDGLDGLAGGLMMIILFVLAVITFFNGTFIATTVIAIIMAILIAFMFYNINPAKIFMGDSGAFALGGLLSALLYMLNMRMGILLPFVVLFGIFIIDTGSSFLQILSKKYRKKKLFAVSPLHHLFEHRGTPETTIVMKAWLIQGILAAIVIIAIFYQFNGKIL
ncbi:MAG: hypothetical protein NTX91_02285 [candidate division SR1 bacterium]|nr:hypothetical protein [candidate division SR1 bacterium]